jgi:hypothetical protein
MSGLNQTFFGPLDKSACFYFYFLSLFFFVVLLFVLFKEVVYVFKNYKSLGIKNVVTGLLVLFNIFLAYFVNRLMYTMCNKSLM